MALCATRYVQPLREGGSLPAIVDTEDGLFVVKFRGAGQGPKALVAELVVGLLARALGLPVPDLELVEVPPPFGRSEPDPEIQDVLRRSHGTNVGLRYLDGAFNFDASAAGDLVDAEFASRLVWLDALVTNPDRTHRNPNLLIWQHQPWLIDHGAALYAHHDWARVDDAAARTAFPLIRDHVLLDRSERLEEIDAEATALSENVMHAVLAQVPDSLLVPVAEGDPLSPGEARERYRAYFEQRLAAAPRVGGAAAAARGPHPRQAPQAGGARRISGGI
jgi:hypothetical protein